MYIVRPEYLKANEQEIYGKHTGSGMSDFYEYNKVAVKASNLWKTINTMSVIPFLTGTNQQLNFSFTTSDRAANLTDGSAVRYRVLLYGYSGGKKTLLYPSPSAMPMPLDHVRAFKNSYPVYDHSSSINITPYYGAGITKYELQITPVIWNGSKITATGKTKKQTITLTSETDRWRTMAPIITHGQREDLDTAYLVWIHGPWAAAEHPDFYEVYDGKKLLCTVDGGTDSDVSHNAYFPLTAPGKHKLTVRAFKLDMDGKKVYGKTSAAFTLEIPKPEKAAPIISYANVNIGSGSTDKIYIQWSNPNPLLTQYEVIVIPRLYSAVFNGISLPEVEKVWSDGIGDYPRWSVSNTSTTIEINNGTGTGGMREQGYLICVIGYPVGRAQKFISDPVYARYDTSNLVYRCETVKLKR